jgi:hypothetical protein
MLPTITDLNDLLVPNMALHCHAPGLVRCDWRYCKFQLALDCSGLFRLSGEFRAEGKGEALGQKNAGGSGIEFVAGDCVWLDEPPQE